MTHNLNTKWVLVTILLGQLLVLTYNLADQSLWTDEIYTARIVSRPSIETVLTFTRVTEARPPGYYLLVWGWLQLLGFSEWGMRFVSVAAMLLTTALAFRLTKILTSPQIAVWSAFFTATAPTLLLYGRMTRAYTLAVPFALLTTWLFWRAWRSSRFYPKLLYLGSIALFVFVDYLTVFLIGSQILYIGIIWSKRLRQQKSSIKKFLSQPDVQQWLGVGVGLFVIMLGLSTILFWQVNAPTTTGLSSHEARISQQLANLGNQIPGLIGASLFIPYSFMIGESILPWHPLALPGVFAGMWLTWLGLRRQWRQDNEKAQFLALLILVPWASMSFLIFGTFLGLKEIVIAAARILYLSPFFYIPIGITVAAGLQRKTVLWLLIILLSARSISTLNLLSNQDFLNPVYGIPVKELVSQVAQNVETGDIVVYDNVLAVDFYFRPFDTKTPLFASGLQVDRSTFEPEITLADLTIEEPNPLIAYLEENEPNRIWLVVFQNEGNGQTIETSVTPYLEQFGPYEPVARIGYAAQDPLFARLRAKVRPRPPIQYKAEVVLYVRQ